MKRLLSIPLLAVIALALLGANSAQAETTFCMHSFVSQQCNPVTERYPSMTVFKLESANPQVSSGFSFTCTNSMLFVKTTAREGVTVPGKVETLNLTGCGGGCTATFTGIPSYPINTSYTGSDHGKGVITPAASQPFKYTCGSTTCTFEIKEMFLFITGGAPATAELSTFAEQTAGPPSCGGLAKVVGNYKFISPNSGRAYVEET